MVSEAKTSQSSPLLWIALLLTIIAVVWTAMQDQDAVESDDLLAPATRVQSSANSGVNENGLLDNETKISAGAKSSYPWLNINREVDTKSIKNLFKPHGWAVKQKAVQMKPMPPAPPQAPPLPFTYMGKLEQGAEGVQVFLMQGNQVLTVNVGDNVNSLWRLDAESESNLTFTYIPLAQQKMMSKGAGMQASAKGRSMTGRSRTGRYSQQKLGL